MFGVNFEMFSILLTLFVRIHLSNAEHNFEHIRLGSYLNQASLFVTFHDMSVGSCIQECETRAKCTSLNYHSGLMYCQLNDGDSTAGTLEEQIGWVYMQSPEWLNRVTVLCVDAECTDAQTCDSGTCKITECDMPSPVSTVTVQGNQVSLGSKLYITCNRGLKMKTGPSLTTSMTSECVDGVWTPSLPDDSTCFPETCQTVAKHQTNPGSGEYEYVDTDTGNVVNMYCDFNFEDGYGYTYLSPESLQHVTDLSIHYTESNHVMVRHVLSSGEQKETKLSTVSNYGQPATVLLSSFDGFTNPIQAENTPYIYVGLVPKNHASWIAGTLNNGYSCDGTDLTFQLCNYEPNTHNNFFAVFYDNGQPSLKNCFDPICAPSTCAIQKGFLTTCVTNSLTRIPGHYFYTKYEMHMGGCGTCMTQDNLGVPGVTGLTFGLKFDITVGK